MWQCSICVAPHHGATGPCGFQPSLRRVYKNFFYFLKMIAIPANSHLQNGAMLAYSVGIDLEISSRIMQLTSK
jgi:hypothetical protein